MTPKQQELYDKLLKKVNEYCLGYAAEDVIAAIDALVDTYETKVAVDDYLLRGVTYYFENTTFRLEDLAKKLKAIEIIKNKGVDIRWIGGGEPFIDTTYAITEEEYELVKEILK